MNYQDIKRKEIEGVRRAMGIESDASQQELADTVKEILAELKSGQELTKPCGFCDKRIPVTSPMGYCHECEMEMGW